MSADEHVRSYLHERGLDFGQLAELVPPLQGREFMMLSGSVGYGLANKESDIDLLVLSERPIDPGPNMVVHFQSFDAWNVRVRDQDVNIELVDRSKVEDVSDRHARMVELLDDPAGTRRLDYFSDSELQWLSRLRDGVVIANEPGAHYWRDRARLDSFPLYLIVKSLSDHLIMREDMIGQYQIGEMECALAMSDQAIIDVTAALLASLGVTCVKHKWQLRLLRRQEAQIGSATVEALMGARFPDRHQARQAVESNVRLSNDIISRICKARPEVAEMMATINKRFQLTATLRKSSS